MLDSAAPVDDAARIRHVSSVMGQAKPGAAIRHEAIAKAVAAGLIEP